MSDKVKVTTTNVHYDQLVDRNREVGEVYEVSEGEAKKREERQLVSIGDSGEDGGRRLSADEQAELDEAGRKQGSPDIPDEDRYFGVNPVSNPKAARSSERAAEGETTTVREPVTNVDPALRGEARDTTLDNQARLTNTELAGSDPARSTPDARVEQKQEIKDGTAERLQMSKEVEKQFRGTTSENGDGETVDYNSVKVADLPGRLAGADRATVERAMKADSRVTAKEAYEARLAELDEEEEG